MEPILTVSNLAVSYDGVAALQPTSFTLEQGATMAVIGPNGAGKSVLIRALLGLEHAQGSVLWAPGVRIGYVPQKIDADRHLPINLRNLLDAKRALVGASREDVGTTIRSVGIEPKLLNTPIGHLSGGEFQRALIALALLGHPSVLILDEPTASIDKPGEGQFYELIHRLQDANDMTVILVSHDLSFVSRYATTVLCLSHAGSVCFGPPEETLTPEMLAQLYESHRLVHHIHEH